MTMAPKLPSGCSSLISGQYLQFLVICFCAVAYVVLCTVFTCSFGDARASVIKFALYEMSFGSRSTCFALLDKEWFVS